MRTITWNFLLAVVLLTSTASAQQNKPYPLPPAESTPAVAAKTVSPPLVFKRARLQTQEGEKTRDREVRIRYDDTALTLLPSGGTTMDAAGNIRTRSDAPILSYPYHTIIAAEYTFGKSPRVAAALLVSPLFLFNSSKSHWITVKTSDDYALIRLDKSNYKLVIAELEKRTAVKVASLGEGK